RKRVKITLECTEWKRRNYITMKSKVNDRERLEMKKYCSHDRRHTVHKETRQRVALARPSGGRRSVGRASVSKTAGRGFESLLPCPAPSPNHTLEVSPERQEK